MEKAAGLDSFEIAPVLNNLAALDQRQGRYADAEPLYRRALAIRARALGPDHPDVATSTSNLAYFLFVSGRTADALPLAEKTLANDRAQLHVVLSILFAARQQSLLPQDKAPDEALAAIQRGTQSSAASAVNKLAVRLAAGSDRLAELVRKDQDLAAESESLDKAIIAAVSKPSAHRDVASEQRSRARIAAITSERAGLQKTLAIEFPDYSSLSNPLPLTVKDVEPLLSADDAMVLYSVVGLLNAASSTARPTASSPATSRVWASHRLRSRFPISPRSSTMACSRRAKSSSSSSMPIGSCCRPATRSPATSRAPKPCRDWRAPSSMPVRARSWFRIGPWIWRLPAA